MNRLIYAASESCPDLLYATRFPAPDPFLFLECKGRRSILLNDLEIDRGRKSATVDEVAALSEVEAMVQGKRRTRPPFAEVAAVFLKERGALSAEVPRDFPLGLAVELGKLGITLKPAKGMLFPQRLTKSAGEVGLMRRAIRITEAGFRQAFSVLAESTIAKDGRLRWKGKVLTSEALRAEADFAMILAGGQPANSIIACAEQACDPHERGSGPLRANELIIIDLFPRDARTGYYGDLTRTVVKGTPSPEQTHLWRTCLAGQKSAIAAIQPGADGEAIHDSIREQFAKAGYPTELHEGRWRGFFHGTGHGLGLEIHEEPRFAAAKFEPGLVLTVEPGIYWPGVGGVRHEDVAMVTETGCEVLSKLPKKLVIP